MSDDKEDGQGELTQDQFNDLMKKLEQFDNRFYIALAGTERVEIIPTMSEDGDFLSKEQYALVTKECSRLGLKILYKVELSNSDIVLINAETMKIGYIRDGVH